MPLPIVDLEKQSHHGVRWTEELLLNDLCTLQACNFKGRLVYDPCKTIHFDVKKIERVLPRICACKNLA